MAKSFVVINDPVHRLVRELTGEVPLRLRLSPDVPSLEYDVDPRKLPAAYYSVALFNSVTALPEERFGRHIRAGELARVPQKVGYFDLVRLDRRCCRDLRITLPQRQRPGLLSCELLTFGTGALRARNDTRQDPIHSYVNRTCGRLHSRLEVVYSRIGALHLNSWRPQEPAWKEWYDSTNVIYGDVFGELEQLWARRADTDFLDQVAIRLQQFRLNGRLRGFLQPPLNLEMIQKLHLKNAIWRVPPSSGRSLLRRLEHVLEHSILDSAPAAPATPGRPQPEDGAEAPPGRGWPADSSGYDGWLS
jgi:hypothetical protein